MTRRIPDMASYSQRSFWLETCGEDLTPRPPLTRSTEVDVAVLGGGYTALWTAYYLLAANPGLRIALLEKEIVGFGASGRNGGWCSSKFPVSPSMLERRFGRAKARALMIAMNGAVDEICRVCEVEQIDAHFHKGGILTLARGEHHLPMIRASFDAYSRLGLADQYALLSPEQARERVRVTQVCGALWAAENASVHPARLARGLARALEKRGCIIYEKTEITEFRDGPAASLITPAGEVRAQRAIVLAGESYLTQLRRLHRVLLPVYSLIALTEPLTEQQWNSIGWQNRESLASCNYTVDYLTRTADGRILFGSRGAPYRFGSRISDDQELHGATHAHIENLTREWFPDLQGIRFTHHWGGSVGMPRDWMPMVAFDPKRKLATARGYTGQGVSTTNLTGRVLAEFISGKRTALSELPIAERESPLWEMEPLRWLAVRYMQNAFRRIDEAGKLGKPEPFDAPLAKYIGRH
ncbi:MAG TPA: FAD-dependent oxidoreductase [Candidatus Sulfotelmatobacter sp.]|jgi:glycine/D-amino acid oxidase-like deaminating enzyme|nr:FAD-dependent oxidoreductase [Candidatus Sulfotelmatobacter sp.]